MARRCPLLANSGHAVGIPRGLMYRNYQGSGLGMPLCKSFVEALGGTIEIESEPGAGTALKVMFPLERVVRGL